jgi:hypothetical protein
MDQRNVAPTNLVCGMLRPPRQDSASIQATTASFCNYQNYVMDTQTITLSIAASTRDSPFQIVEIGFETNPLRIQYIQILHRCGAKMLS